ncbi:5-formyltetrahydrofolate cyclo-ligase isoform X4 [Hippopotamus amphibius kiboko]|uniref:5-formyltetrahydrofolate cyclo-ligase isoform X4 n=1 Tax=Hippopotamus amphibius kiboko TaxID=575201 RepID=UPI002594ADBC|nr:5-formyltetrahydrofolate cyclo-ligase isoform X4 [Hippopotamus amphibius kiboko]
MAAAAVSGAKRGLRAELKQRLRALSAEERLRQSRLLAQKVFTHSQYQKSKRISIFLSMQDEIETEEIIKDIFQQGKTCFIPRYQFQSSHMDMVKLASVEEISSLPKTSWNIHQPGEDEVREEALSTGGTIHFLFLLPPESTGRRHVRFSPLLCSSRGGRGDLPNRTEITEDQTQSWIPWVF